MSKTIISEKKSGSRNWLIIAALLLLLPLGGGAFWYFRPDPEVTKAVEKIKQWQQDMFGENSSALSVEERRHKMVELSQMLGDLTDAQRRQVEAELAKFGPMGMNEQVNFGDNREGETAKNDDNAAGTASNSGGQKGVAQDATGMSDDDLVNNYFTLTPQKKTQMLDQMIDQLKGMFDKVGGYQAFMDAMNASRSNPARNDRQRMQGLDMSTPSQRAFAEQFRNDFNARCVERGIPPLLEDNIPIMVNGKK